jgi:hypothetical protein
MRDGLIFLFFCGVDQKRLFVESAVYDEVVAKSAKLAKARAVGNPFDPNTRQGPQVSQEQFDRVGFFPSLFFCFFFRWGWTDKLTLHMRC